MDKETKEGMKNLDVTVSAADLVKNASSEANETFQAQERDNNAADTTNR